MVVAALALVVTADRPPLSISKGNDTVDTLVLGAGVCLKVQLDYCQVRPHPSNYLITKSLQKQLAARLNLATDIFTKPLDFTKEIYKYYTKVMS